MSINQQETTFTGFQKRNGTVVPFCAEKIERAVYCAIESVARKNAETPDPEKARAVTKKVISELRNPSCEYFVRPDREGKYTPNIEDVQDLVEVVLAEQGMSLEVASFKRYRRQREMARQRIRVRNSNGSAEAGVDVTDASLLLVQSVSKNIALPWDRERIVRQLMEETNLPSELANSVAKSVENQVISSELSTVSSTLIRELVNNELAERNCREQLRDLSLYAVPKDFVQQLMFTKSTENSNIVNNNPEAVNLGLAELILKQWALDTIFSPEVKRAHDTGAIHVHDLGYPHRVYCSSHSVEYVKKYGLRDLVNLNTESKPARSASVLTGHLNTFLASMQANYAGALGIAYINIFYAPLLEGFSEREYKQVAQELIFNGSQNAFSRGGQTLFLDFNIHTGVPEYMKNVPAIGAGGRYLLKRSDGSKSALIEVLSERQDASENRLMDLYLEESDGKRRLVFREVYHPAKGLIRDEVIERELRDRGEEIVTYGDYLKETRLFAKALLEVFSEGDRHGRVFEFPKCDFHISEETFLDAEQYEIFLQACDLASKNGSTYFIFDRDAVTLSACCRLRTTIQDNWMLSHPESLRFCGFQNVTLNIPQAAYRAARKGEKNLDGLWRELEGTMETAVLAHLEKKAKTAEMMSSPGRPLYQIGRPACDGRPYVELDNCTYILGLIGLNDALKFLYGAEMHENEDILELGLRLVSRMYLKTKELSERHGLKFSLEESPAESAARRLARTDLVYFPEAKGVIKGGSEEVAYYTNSIHLAPEAQTSLTQRIRLQSKFHSLIESGAIIHAFVGEQRPEPASVAALVSNTFYLTQAAQLTISPEFTHCRSCEEISRGLHECCPGCGSSDVAGETRVVGYFSKIENWNKSKRYGELLDRHRGQYAVETLHGQPALSEMMEIRNTEDSADEQEIPPERLRKDWVRQVQGA